MLISQRLKIIKINKTKARCRYFSLIARGPYRGVADEKYRTELL